MPPFAAACRLTEEDGSEQHDDISYEAQLADWLAQGDAFSPKSPGAGEATFNLKVSNSSTAHRQPMPCCTVQPVLRLCFGAG